MKSMWRKLGVLSFWITRPVLGLVLKRTTRTRVLVEYNGEILVVKSWLSDGKWALPGGGIQKGESALQAARRELQEETGIKVAPQELHDLFTAKSSRGGLQFNCRCFVVAMSQKPPLSTQPFEIVDAQWLLPTTVTRHNANADVLQALAVRQGKSSNLIQ